MTERIYTKNAAYQRLETFKANRVKRQHFQSFFVEGVRNINEAVHSGWRIASFLYTRERALSNWAEGMLRNVQTEKNYELTAELMRDLSGKEDTSELLAIVRMRKDDARALPLSPVPLLALFDRPSNHGNLGSILRSADGMGMDGLLITGHACDLYAPEVLAASMGSFFRVRSARIAENEELFAYIDSLHARYPGFQTVATSAHNARDIAQVDLTRPTLLMIGNETDGLARALKERADVLATIPMQQGACASSFNVACAATVLFFEALRQRRGINIALS